MGKIQKHPPVKLITGFIFKEEAALKKAEAILIRKFGRIDFQSQVLPFTYTDYYEKEFGRGLKRKFISFQKLIPAYNLSKIKVLTNQIEEKLSEKDVRLINIDPGYLDLAKFILASTKDYKHRIYLDKGIFAEITLFYQGKTFMPWEWTYPDYKTPEYITVFNQVREIYSKQLKCTHHI